MKKKFFIIAGEKSGDLLGSKILQNINKDIFDIYGIGGELMLKNGLKESLFPMEELSLMGIFEILPKIYFSVNARVNIITKAATVDKNRVAEKNLISAINLSPDGVAISGKNIELDGNTTVTGNLNLLPKDQQAVNQKNKQVCVHRECKKWN